MPESELKSVVDRTAGTKALKWPGLVCPGISQEASMAAVDEEGGRWTDERGNGSDPVGWGRPWKEFWISL